MMLEPYWGMDQCHVLMPSDCNLTCDEWYLSDLGRDT